MRLHKRQWLAYAIGLVLGFVATYVFWSLFFVPNGTGANVVVGLLIAGGITYTCINSVGPRIIDAILNVRPHVATSLYTKRLEKEISRFERKGAETPRMVSMAMRAVASDVKNGRTLEGDTKANIAAVERYITEETKRRAKFRQVPGGSMTVAIIAALVLRGFVLQPYQIPSASMVPTLLIGDHLFVTRFDYGIPTPFKESYIVRWAEPEVGDIVVFTAPPYVQVNAGEPWIKRVVAVAGQRISIDGTGLMTVDDKAYPQTDVTYDASYENYTAGGWTLRKNIVHKIEQTGEVSHAIYQNQPEQIPWPGRLIDSLPGLKCGPETCTVREGHVLVVGDNRNNSHDGRRWGAVPIDNIKGTASRVWLSVNGSKHTFKLGAFFLPDIRWSRFMKGID